MQLVKVETKFGASLKSGKSLVAELYKTGKVIVFEKAYGDELAKLATVHTVTNSHSGKTNWVAKLDDKALAKLEKVLAKMEFIHTPGVKKNAGAVKVTKAKTAGKKPAASSKKQATTKR